MAGPAKAAAVPFFWVDTHCHLDAQEFSPLALECRALAAIKNVAHVVIPAVLPSHAQRVRELAYASGDGYALGLHPLWIAHDADAQLQQLARALHDLQDDPRLLAVGEIGLDAFVPALCEPQAWARQMQVFKAQLRLAREFDLPVLIHSRRAVDAVAGALRALGPGYRWRGIAHAFNGSLQQAQALIDLGLKLGFGGACTYERALQLRRLVRELPLQALVLETDAPDMPPTWLYVPAAQRAGGAVQPPNSPAELPRIGEVVAALRGISPAELAHATTQNACAALPKLQVLLNPQALQAAPAPCVVAGVSPCPPQAPQAPH
jgi:TatD DNase family protein